ncbi:hypothetical protein [Streptomyces sp. NPDC052042]|uniref:hypothetical protein n=1 Tax=Streptomyces sp. NPDC052042 TaxID=3365683 RepID=UPI0037D0977E
MPSTIGHPARLAALVLLLVFVATPAVGAEARAPTTSPRAAAWTARPAASGSGEGGDRPYFYLEGPPGAVLQDRLSLTNPGTAPVVVRLRGADAYRAEDGGRAVRGGWKATGAGAWLRTAAAKVTVPARTRAEVPFSVTVPTDAAPGDHPGVIVAQSGDRSVDVRVHLRVGGPALAALTVEDVTVSGRAVHYTLVNRGNTVLVPRLGVSADGVFGALLRRGDRTLPVRLPPGRSVTLTEPWRDAPALDTATVRLRVTAAGGAHDEASARAVFVPWAPTAGGAVLLLTAAAMLASAYRRRLRHRHRRSCRSGGTAATGAATTSEGVPTTYENATRGRSSRGRASRGWPANARQTSGTRHATRTGGAS